MPQEFHLVLEPLDPPQAAPRPGPKKALADPEKLILPEGVSFLATDRAGRPILHTDDPGWAQAPVAIEPLAPDGGPGLVMVGAPAATATVNGLRAPWVAPLREQDRIHFAGGAFALHVCLYNDPDIGPAGESLAGAQCPCCRTKVRSDQTVYRCACGKVVMHLEQPEKGEDRLECARLHPHCPHCRRPVVTRKGYSYLPPGLEGT